MSTARPSAVRQRHCDSTQWHMSLPYYGHVTVTVMSQSQSQCHWLVVVTCDSDSVSDSDM